MKKRYLLLIVGALGIILNMLWGQAMSASAHSYSDAPLMSQATSLRAQPPPEESLPVTAQLTDTLDIFNYLPLITKNFSSPLSCIDFEDPPLGQEYRLIPLPSLPPFPNSFNDSGATITLKPFTWSSGVVTDTGFARIWADNRAAGALQEVEVNNVNLDIDFGGSTSFLALRFGEYGGNLNLDLNGTFLNFDNFADLPSIIPPPFNATVLNGFGNDPGILELSGGTITSFTIGGQELYIDDICPFPLINSLTGEPYSREDLERILFLKKKFPNNPLIPGNVSVSDVEKQKQRLDQLRKKIIRRTASASEVEEYYQAKINEIDHRLELVNFVLSEKTWDEKTRARYQRVKDTSEQHKSRLQSQSVKSIQVIEHANQAGAEREGQLSVKIDPPTLTVKAGEVAHFAAVAPVGLPELEKWVWKLDFSEIGQEAEINLATDHLRPGAHDIDLEVSDALGKTGKTKAYLIVTPDPDATVDLILGSIELALSPDPMSDAALYRLFALVENAGQSPAKDVTISFSAGTETLYSETIASIEPGWFRIVYTQGFAKETLQAKELSAKAELSPTANGASEVNTKNNAMRLTPARQSAVLNAVVGTISPGDADRPAMPNYLAANPFGPTLAMENFINETRPLPFFLGTPPGFADLHLHQLAHLGYDGRNLWGSAGQGAPLAASTAPGDQTNHGLCWVPGAAINLVMGPGNYERGAHAGWIGTWGFDDPYCLLPSPKTILGVPIETPGQSIHGWHADGSQAFEHWPIWKTTTHQQVHREWLELAHQQGLNLIVMSAVNSSYLCLAIPSHLGFGGAHPLDGYVLPNTTNVVLDQEIADLDACNDMKNVRRQLVAAWIFAETYPWYEIALTPGMASQIMNEGNLAVVLSIEASHFLNNVTEPAEIEEMLDYVVNDLGVRAIQPIHQLNNAYGGSAYFDGLFDFIQILDNFSNESSVSEYSGVWDNLAGIQRNSDGENRQDLTMAGETLIELAMDRNLLIDIAHMSRLTSDDVYQLALNNNAYPLFSSHTRYGDLLVGDPHDDHLAKDWRTIAQIKQLGGIVGLRTTNQRQREYLLAPAMQPCFGSTVDFVYAYSYGAIAYDVRQAFGTDLNGYIQQLRPRFYQTGNCKYCTRAWACNEGLNHNINQISIRNTMQDIQQNPTGNEFDLAGFGHIGRIGPLLDDVEALGMPTTDLWESAADFVGVWYLTYSPTRPLREDCVDRTNIVGDPALAGPLNTC